VIYIGEQAYPYLSVVINIRKGKGKTWTMFRADRRYVFDENGQKEERWMKAK